MNGDIDVRTETCTRELSNGKYECPFDSDGVSNGNTLHSAINIRKETKLERIQGRGKRRKQINTKEMWVAISD